MATPYTVGAIYRDLDTGIEYMYRPDLDPDCPFRHGDSQFALDGTLERVPVRPALTDGDRTPEFYLGEARGSIAKQMVQRVNYRNALVDQIIAAQETLRVNEDLLTRTNAQIGAMQAALDIIPTHISH